MSDRGKGSTGIDYLRVFEVVIAVLGLFSFGLAWIARQVAKIPWQWIAVALIVLLLLMAVALIAARKMRVRRRTRQRAQQMKALQDEAFSALDSTLKDLEAELPRLPVSHPVQSLREEIEGKSSYVGQPFAHRSVQPLTTESESFTRVLGDPVDYALEALQGGKSILVTGEPGSGKSVMAAVAFAALADEYLSAPGEVPLPLFVRLNAVAFEEVVSSGAPKITDFLPDCWGFLSPEDLQLIDDAQGIVLVLDGLDEVGLAGAPHVERVHLPKDLDVLFGGTCMVTCREAFHDLYVASSPLHRYFDDQIAVLPLEPKQIRLYVEDFCARHERAGLARPVMDALDASDQLMEMASRPLLLRMTTHVLLSEIAAPSRSDVTSAATEGSEDDGGFLTVLIYERYIRDWLHRELQRTHHGQLELPQTLALVQAVAYQIFRASTDTDRAYSAYQLGDLLISKKDLIGVVETWAHGQHAQDCEDEAIQQITDRTFLLVAHVQEMKYRFAHKTFYEYLLARYVVASLSASSSDDHVQHSILLGAPFPDEVIDFVRQLLSYAQGDLESPFDPRAIEANFMRVVNMRDESSLQLMARQQAANLVPIVASKRTMRDLQQLAGSSDLHPFIQRAICVGAALHHADSAMLDDFVHKMDEDDRARSFHMGYNRIYYGDQPLSSHTFEDDQEPECSRFFRASLRHLQQPRYLAIRLMAAASIEYMLLDPQRHRYLQDSDPDALLLARQVFSDWQADVGSPLYTRRQAVLDLLQAGPAESRGMPA